MLQIYFVPVFTDVLLKNKTARHQKPVTVINGLTEYYKMIIRIYRSFCACQPKLDLFCRNYGNSNVQHLLINLETTLIQQNQYSDCLL